MKVKYVLMLILFSVVLNVAVVILCSKYAACGKDPGTVTPPCGCCAKPQ